MKAGRWIFFMICTLGALAVGILLPDLVFRSQDERLYGEAVSFETARLRFRLASQLTDRLRLANSSYTRVNLDSGTYHDAQEIWENAWLAVEKIASFVYIPGLAAGTYTNHQETAFLAIAGSDMQEGSYTGEPGLQDSISIQDSDQGEEPQSQGSYRIKDERTGLTAEEDATVEKGGLAEEGSAGTVRKDSGIVVQTEPFDIIYYKGIRQLPEAGKPSDKKDGLASPEEDVATAVFWECRIWDEKGHVLNLIMDDDSGKMVSFELQYSAQYLSEGGDFLEGYGFVSVYQPHAMVNFCIQYYGLEEVRTAYVMRGEDTNVVIHLDASDSYGSQIFFSFGIEKNGRSRFNNPKIMVP